MAAETITNVNFEQIQVLFEELFEVGVDEVTMETQFGDLPKWDSMGHMDLMVALEGQFGIEINADSISQLVSVVAILDSIQTQQND